MAATLVRIQVMCGRYIGENPGFVAVNIGDNPGFVAVNIGENPGFVRNGNHREILFPFVCRVNMDSIQIKLLEHSICWDFWSCTDFLMEKEARQTFL